jgi:hypothetical protein
MVVTGASGYCPVYSLTGISTCGTDKPEGGHRDVLHLHHRAA